jgi:hypothetical protein
MSETPSTVIWRTWFPAVVRLPGGVPLLRAKVFATSDGLRVFAQRNGAELVFQSPILLDKTVEPGTDYVSLRRGHSIVTEAGTVSIAKGGGCACGMRDLKSLQIPGATERKWGE